MKKFKNFVIGGIQQKVFNLVLYAIVLVVVAYTAVIAYQVSQLRSLVAQTSEQQRETITETVQKTMDERLTNNLGETTQMEAYIADDMFRDLTGAVTMMADYAQKLFANPGAYPAREVHVPDPATNGQTSVQLLTEEGVNTADPAVAEQLALVGNMSDLLAALFEGSHINSCYIALPSGVMLLADNDPASKFADDGTLMPIQMTQRPWYTGAVSKRGIYFTDVARDVFTGQVGIMCGMPIYRNEELVAVVGADLLLDSMAQSVANSTEGEDFTCIVNQQGHVVFSPRTEGVFRVEESSKATDIRRSSSELAAFVNEALEGVTAPTAIEVDGVSYYLCGAPIGTVGWAVINAVSQEATDAITTRMLGQFDTILNSAQSEYDGSLSHSLTTIIVLLVITLALALTGAVVLAKRIVGPLGLITNRVQSLGGDDLQFMMEDSYRTGDEIEVLAEAFARLSAKTLQYVDQVTRVTAEKERIGAELDMATDIQASQLPRLFPAFPNRPEFDIFASMTPAKEVGGDFYDFFLIDDDHIGLVMADVSGKGVPAALFMMVSRVLIKSHLQNGEGPAEALMNVNDQLCESNEADLFVTVWAAVLQISTGKGVAVNAGHEHPVMRRANGEYELVVYRHSPAAGLMEGIPYRDHSFELHPGDSLFVYTDGVAEATSASNELFGTDRMLEALNTDPDASPKEVLAHVTEGVAAFVGEAEQFDDLTMLCIKYIGPQTDQS